MGGGWVLFLGEVLLFWMLVLNWIQMRTPSHPRELGLQQLITITSQIAGEWTFSGPLLARIRFIDNIVIGNVPRICSNTFVRGCMKKWSEIQCSRWSTAHVEFPLTNFFFLKQGFNEKKSTLPCFEQVSHALLVFSKGKVVWWQSPVDRDWT